MKSIVRNALLALACGLQVLFLGAHASAAGAGPVADTMPQTVVYGNCSWDHPGVNPFMGDVVAAVDRYRDISPEVRARLKARMEKREYDDLVVIHRDDIQGRGGYDYGNTISDMHFGTHQLCRSVTRTSWSPQMEERGLVYCESGQCILVPTVCRNVSRITRSGVGPDAAAAPPLLPELGAAEAALPPIDFFGPTGAGLPAGADLPAGDLFGGAGGDAAPLPFALGDFVGPAVVVGGFVAATGSLTGSGPVDVSATATSPIGSDVGGHVAAVPEPSSWALVLLGLVAVAWAAYRRRSGDSRGR